MPSLLLKCFQIVTCYYSGFRKRKARVRKCNRFPRQKGGHGPRRFMRRLRKLGMRTTARIMLSCVLCCIMLSYYVIMLWANGLGIRNSSEIMLCFVNNVWQGFMLSTLMSQRNAHAVRGRATVNDVERFRNGSLIHEFYSCKDASVNSSSAHPPPPG